MGERFDPGSAPASGEGGGVLALFRAGQPIFSQGDPADGVFRIVRGRVKLTAASERGKAAVVALLGPGDYFGEGALLGRSQRATSATAMTAGAAVRLETAEMERRLHADAAFADRFTAYLLARNSRVEADLADQLLNPGEKRLARALLLLATPGKDGAPSVIEAPVTHELLAEMIGATRPRITHFMSKFRRLGFVEYNGRLEVRAGLLDSLLHDTRS